MTIRELNENVYVANGLFERAIEQLGGLADVIGSLDHKAARTMRQTLENMIDSMADYVLALDKATEGRLRTGKN